MRMFLISQGLFLNQHRRSRDDRDRRSTSSPGPGEAPAAANNDSDDLDHVGGVQIKEAIVAKPLDSPALREGHILSR